jgi:nucleotide-binding universal stress UspA family protein
MSPIIACTDGSLYSPSIYANAAWAAARLHSSVHVLHVIERGEIVAPHDLSGSIGFHANTELLEELARFDESHARIAKLRGNAILSDACKALEALGLEVLATQRHGSLVETLMEFETDASLLVLGKRGEQADFSSGHLGSNLERVIRSAQSPVLVAARAFRPIQRFLIAFDGGPSSLKAIHHAITQPLLAGLECHLIGVGKPDSDLDLDLESAAQTLRQAGYQVTAELLQGEPEDVIASQTERRSIDLLVMGAYGHSRIRQLFLGSTTTALMRNCLLPILLFR